MPKKAALPVIPKTKHLAEPVRKKAKVEPEIDKEPAGAEEICKDAYDAQHLIETATKAAKDAEEICKDAYDVVQAMAKNLKHKAKNLKHKQCAIAAQRGVFELEANMMLRDAERD